MHRLAACPTSCLIERKDRGRNGQSREEERVSGKLLIKYKSIVCHLSGRASTSPLRENMERWRGGSIRRTSGRDKCLIHQSNYITAIKETSGLCEVGGSMLQHLFRPLLLFEMISRARWTRPSNINLPLRLQQRSTFRRELGNDGAELKSTSLWRRWSLIITRLQSWGPEAVLHSHQTCWEEFAVQSAFKHFVPCYLTVTLCCFFSYFSGCFSQKLAGISFSSGLILNQLFSSIPTTRNKRPKHRRTNSFTFT